MIVTAAHGDTLVSIDTDDPGHSPDIVEDLCRRASTALVVTVMQLISETATAD